MPLPLLVSGATGLVGTRLLPALVAAGHDVRALSRRAASLSRFVAQNSDGPLVSAIPWDGVTPPEGALRGAHAVIHLAGEPVFGGPPTAARRRRIYSSRIDSTLALVERLATLPADGRPKVLVCASAVGYYGDRGEQELGEEAPPGDGFLARVCIDWEQAARRAEDLGVRVVRLRIGLVLAASGGALALMRTPFRLGLGGRLGHGRQWMPWIDLDDLVALIQFSLGDGLAGAVNAVAPAPVRNADFTSELAAVLRRPALLPLPGFALRVALGSLSGELLGSRRALPRAALAAGFEFLRPELGESLRSQLL